MRNDYKNQLSKLLPSAFLVFSVLYGPPASASLSQELDQLFSNMTNSTSAGTFSTQRRGVIAGGRFTAKTRIVTPNIVSFVPPSISAGCGGIDMFGGSLSFVNKDQLVQLFRTVAANASGYAFQLALDNVFPDGSKWIEAMQQKIQKMNEMLGNSCEMAQGLVDAAIGGNDGGTSPSILRDKIAATDIALAGATEDAFSSFYPSTGKSATQNQNTYTPAIAKAKDGNLVWKQLKKNNVQGWFKYGDNALLEQLMSITGTVVIGDLVQDPGAGSSDVQTQPIIPFEGNLISLVDLVDGTTTASVYSCGSDTTNCYVAGSASGAPLTPTIKTGVTIKGFASRLEASLLGANNNSGIIYKFANNTGSLTADEEGLMEVLPAGMGAIVRNLSVLSPEASRMFVKQSSGAIALDMMYSVSLDMMRAARGSLVNSNSVYKSKAIDMIDKAETKIRAEYQSEVSKKGNLSDLLAHYNNLLDNVRKNKYMVQELTYGQDSKESR